MTYNPQPPLGQAIKAASLPVTLASDQNNYTVLTGNVPFGQSGYASTQSVGGLIAIPTGLGANAAFRVFNLALFLEGGAMSGTMTGVIALFNANPTGTTFTDGTAVSLAAADIPKLKHVGIYSFSIAAFANGAVLSNTAANAQPGFPGLAMNADAAGSIYMALMCAANWTVPAPNKLFYQLELETGTFL